MKECCLCSSLISRPARAEWDRPLLETPNFFVLPSLGSLVEGWLLVVPKKHYICMGALPPYLRTEMLRLKDNLASHLTSKYGNACAFEHGPGAESRAVGCGVDHAHLHILPLDFDLAKAATPFMPLDASWSTAAWENCRIASAAGLDYLYLEQPLGNGLISVHRSFGSQVFRKAIATHLGMPEQFSWREYPKPEVIAETIRGLAAFLNGRPARPTEAGATA